MNRIHSFSIRSEYTGPEGRNLHVCVPKDYETRPDTSYPVLYMHDGQNLFLDALAFQGVSWGVPQALAQAEKAGKTEGVIVVGIENAGDRRMAEYSEWPYVHAQEQVYGASYAAFVAETVKPEIDRRYRTRPGRESTWLAGSSAGANITLSTAFRYPEVFSRLGLFSAATWIFAPEDVLGFLRARADHLMISSMRAFIYTGTEEGGKDQNPEVAQLYIEAALDLYRGLLTFGLSETQLALQIRHGKIHHETAWKEVFPDFLDFLLRAE